MSNTTRWIQPGWDGLTLNSPPKSKKHQGRDNSDNVSKSVKKFSNQHAIPTVFQHVKDEKTLREDNPRYRGAE